MANTVIQIKRSNATSAPTNGSLAAAEPAYSFNSDKLFLGTSDGTQVIEIGGQYYVNVATQANTTANYANLVAHTAATIANNIISAAGINIFSNISVGGTFLVADSNADVLTVQSGNGIVIAANAAQDSYNITLSATGVTPTTYGGSETVTPTFTVDAHGRITFAGNVTVTNAAAVAIAANSYADAVGAGANSYMITVQNGSNTAVGAGANTYADATFVKLTAPNQTITSNLSIVGSLTVSGNTTYVNVNDLQVSDPLIYLASNNYVSDIVDIGFIGNYVNATGQNVHTGLYREHVDKMYYLFQGYDAEPVNNHLGAFSNNMTLAVLNADLITNNLSLAGVNAITWITSAFDKANAANVLAFNTGIGANAYADAVGAGANAYMITVQNGSNTAVGAGANAYAAFVAGLANTYAVAAFSKANGAAYLAFGTVSAGGTSLVADSNNDTLTITSGNGVILIADSGTDSFNIALSPTGVTATTYGGADTVGRFTVDAWGRITSAANAAIALAASAITSGSFGIARGGTGLTTITTNGILYGQESSPLAVTAAGTEGQVLQAAASGVPSFGMLDGGTF